eukprot:CAMPEP_0206603122 /NCGR_PEP_ID=MMETSP0325_2-20121206/48038_1 /ASSEMBLY_ACC=CAM_ASM_000347 /TAXON_ID=2866 /ORGANISM="Crypthecodinium cohnii, Strain Seligo" /LENGTH=33 /DNA_ID= /DNA_START= /DNA_END= /DNA_ORIENTATION=
MTRRNEWMGNECMEGIERKQGSIDRCPDKEAAA